MDTTSFYFETDNFRYRTHVKIKRIEEINEKTKIEKIYSELKTGEKNK